MNEIVVALVSGSLGAGLMSIVLACLQRHWKKKDEKDTRLDAIVDALKLIMIDQVKTNAKRFIRVGRISLGDKEHLKEQHDAYKALGGNGHLDTTMEEVNHLKVIDE